MTGRERLLAALRCEPVDEMPVTVVVDGFNCPVGIPSELLTPLDMVAIGRYLKCAVIDRLGPSPIVKTPRQCTSEVTYLDGGDQVHEHVTPVGTLRARYALSREAGTMFLVGHCVEGPKGYESLTALVEDAAIQISESGVAAARERLEYIGGDGILYTVAPSTPIMDLTRTWVGLARFLCDLQDYPVVVRRALAAMAAKAYEEYEAIAANTPAKAIVFYDDVTSAHLSPALFREFVLPVYARYADICHGHGKLLVAHACGHLRAFLPMFLETGVDAIDWLTPPPTGDTAFAEAQRAFGGRICVMGALVPAVMRFGTPNEVVDHVRQVLTGVDRRRGFVLMVPPPVGTPMANVAAVWHALECT